VILIVRGMARTPQADTEGSLRRASLLYQEKHSVSLSEVWGLIWEKVGLTEVAVLGLIPMNRAPQVVERPTSVECRLHWMIV